MALFISEQDIRQLPLSIEAAIPVMEETFRLAATAAAENGPRVRMPFRNGFLQFGPGALHSKRVVGFKLWANFGRGSGVHKGNQGYDFLYSMENGELLAIMPSYIIGKYRTSAVSAVAVKYLSPPDAASIGLYSAGRIAEGQLEAVCRVRPIRRVRVYSRRPKEREDFCQRMSAHLGIDVVPANAPEEVPREADIIITASTSETPILFGEWLSRPCLVVAAGANHWYKREIDGRLIERANLIVVDDKDQARLESGNLLWAAAHGLMAWQRVEELGSVVSGRIEVPNLRQATILFGSHGLSTTDVAMAAKAYELARAHKLGTDVPL